MRGPTSAQAGSDSSAWRSAASAPGCTTRSGLQTRTHSGGAGSPASAARPRLTPAPKPTLRPGRTMRTGRAGGPSGSSARAAAALPAAPFSTTTTGRRPVLEEGADAAFEQRPGVVVDDDGADRGRTPGAQYSRVKRNFTSARSALKPSRQVIFFPSSGSRPA